MTNYVWMNYIPIMQCLSFDVINSIAIATVITSVVLSSILVLMAGRAS